MGHTLLAHLSIPLIYWDHSFSTTTYLINRLLTHSLPNHDSLFHALYGKQPYYKTRKVFGCSCFPLLRPYNKHKLQLRSQECVYLGVSTQHKGFKCLSKDGRIYVSKDVTFN